MSFSWIWIQWLIRLVMVPVILRRRFAPATSLAWLSVIFLLPELGLIVYLLLGAPRLSKRRVRLYRKATARLQDDTRMIGQREHGLRPEIDPAQHGVILQAERISGMPILGGNDVELLADHDRAIDRMISDIDGAEQHVHLMSYIFAPDSTGRRVADALRRAARRGVRCRVLADHAGSRQFFGRRGQARSLRDTGVETYPALPVRLLRRRLQRLDLRNHRKLTVIDGYTAYAGSGNIVNAGFGHGRAGRFIDLSGRFTGPIVAQLQTVFLEDWLFETGQNLETPDILPNLAPTGSIPAQAVPTGPARESATLLHVAIAAINASQRRIIITSPYLVPDEPTMLALTMAAQRGVQVDLVIPHRSDHPLVSAAGRAYFESLLDAGVNIYLHETGMLHTKIITVDDGFALIGSANFDIRSFYLNFELSVLLYGPQITQELRAVQTRYISDATPVDPERWSQRSALQRYGNSTAALLSPLL